MVSGQNVLGELSPIGRTSSVNFAGATSKAYVTGPMQDRRFERFFPASVIPFASRVWSSLSAYWTHVSTFWLNSPIRATPSMLVFLCRQFVVLCVML